MTNYKKYNCYSKLLFTKQLNIFDNKCIIYTLYTCVNHNSQYIPYKFFVYSKTSIDPSNYYG